MEVIKKRGRPQKVVNEPVLIEGVTPETVIEPVTEPTVETVVEPTVEGTPDGSTNLGEVALKYYVRLEDGVGNNLGTTVFEFNGLLGEARAFLEGEAPTGLILNNVQTGGVDFQLDGFSKPLKVVTIEEA